LNKFYDIIMEEYTRYKLYNDFFEKEKTEAKEKRQKFLENALKKENPEEGLEEQLFDLISKEKVYSSDVQLLFNNLYILVKTYQQLEDMMLLPNDLVEMCTQFEHIVPKTLFVVNQNGVEEREKGVYDSLREAWYKTGALEVIKKQIAEQLKNTPSE